MSTECMTNPLDESADIGSDFITPFREGRFRGLSTSGFHEIAYTDWGAHDAESTVICVHGLTRQGRDFDRLAAALAARGHRVICPDLPGRGASQWLRTATDYAFPQHCADMNALMARFSGPVSWVGTSLGGLIGMVLAGAAGSPIERIVLNDIGPQVSPLAVGHLGVRIASMRDFFESLDHAEDNYRRVFAECGPMNDQQWRDFVSHSIRFDESLGRYRNRLDPQVTAPLNLFMYYQIPFWAYFREIRAPILSIRGERSDVLPLELVQQMQRVQPALIESEIADVGHMPMLMSEFEIETIASFLGPLLNQ